MFFNPFSDLFSSIFLSKPFLVELFFHAEWHQRVGVGEVISRHRGFSYPPFFLSFLPALFLFNPESPGGDDLDPELISPRGAVIFSSLLA